MVKIGNVTIDTNVFLAPMAGCTDLAFRLIAREYGAKFCFYEMIDANSISRSRRQSFKMLSSTPEDSPVAAQILGSDPEMMLDAANKVIANSAISFLDVNCACPAKKVIRKKAGAYLLKDTYRLYPVLKRLVSSLKLPVTIKVRIGYDRKDERDIVNTLRHCEDAGAAAIFVHGRLATQGYAGDIDYGFIKKIKESVKIPVFGSGNVFSAQEAKVMFDSTGCDGILVARGALGSPWIFPQIHEYIKNGAAPSRIPLEERKKTLIRHLDLTDRLRDMSRHGKLGFMRKIAIWYLKKMPRATVLRGKITSAKSYEELLKVIHDVGHP